MGRFGDLGEEKVNLGRKWVETEDEGKSSCEKLRAVLLVVAVCQNAPSEIQIPAKVPKTGFSDLRSMFGRPSRFGGPSSKLNTLSLIFSTSQNM